MIEKIIEFFLKTVGWEHIVNAAILLIIGFLGYKWLKLKQVIKELADAFVKTNEALQDDKLTKEELKVIMKEWLDVFNSIVSLKGNAATKK